LAGFQVIIYGRFWVITEAVSRAFPHRLLRSGRVRMSHAVTAASP